jgi:hypothetical protein
MIAEAERESPDGRPRLRTEIPRAADGVLRHAAAPRKTNAGLLRSVRLPPRPAQLPDKESRPARTHRRSVPRRVDFRDAREYV